MRPILFMGSSTEALDVARAMEDRLSSEVEVRLWSNDFFGLNAETLDTLLKTIALYDFAVFVLGADDVAVSRWKPSRTPRDNVVLELGMYMGRLGRRRSFAVCEAGSKLPSDLNGLTIPRYKRPRRKGDDLAAAVEEACQKILRAIRERVDQAELSLLPSTALAIGYFENFVKPVCTHGKLTLNGRDWNLAKDHHRWFVLIPSDFGPTFHPHLGGLLDKCGLSAVSVDAGGARPFPFHVDANAPGDRLEIFDVPTTLSTIPRAIELHLGKEYIGADPRETEMLNRELRNFAKTLRCLLDKPKHARLKEIVEVREWNGLVPLK